MKKLTAIALATGIVIFVIACNDQEQSTARAKMESDLKKNGVYGSMEAYGEHLVTICGCKDCHTPKKMGPAGPEIDSARLLSGHPANAPALDFDHKAMAQKGMVVTSDLTEWAGPWGTIFNANLTPDDTGLANWTLEQFKNVLGMVSFMV